jgi:DNA adenine methylase
MKFIGSKSKIAKYIIPIMLPYLKKCSAYWEPFCGGCNLIDKIPNLPASFGYYASDGNPYLIEMWLALQNGWQPPDSLTKEEYQAVKTLKDKDVLPKHYIGFVGHNCSFSGDWFAGYAGTGETRNRCLEAKNNLLKQIQSLKRVLFYHANYNREDSLGFKNHVIYCDPPYYNGFKYKGSEFDFNHEEFWDWCRIMAKNNVVFVSDYYAPDDFELVWEQEVNINAHQTKQKKAIERLYKVK